MAAVTFSSGRGTSGGKKVKERGNGKKKGVGICTSTNKYFLVEYLTTVEKVNAIFSAGRFLRKNRVKKHVFYVDLSKNP